MKALLDMTLYDNATLLFECALRIYGLGSACQRVLGGIAEALRSQFSSIQSLPLSLVPSDSPP